VPNCTTTGLAMTLKPLQDAFGIRHVVMTSLQGCSDLRPERCIAEDSH